MRTFLQMYLFTGGRGRRGREERQGRGESLGDLGHPSTVGASSPPPTLVATGHWPLIAWLLPAVCEPCTSHWVPPSPVSLRF